MNTVGGFRRTRYRGLDRTGLASYLLGTAYNLARKARLMTAETPVPQGRITKGCEAAPHVTGPEVGALHRPSHHPTTRHSAAFRTMRPFQFGTSWWSKLDTHLEWPGVRFSS